MDFFLVFGRDREPGAAFLPETLYLVSDASYRQEGGAFLVRREGLRDFIDAHGQSTGMFDSDTLMIGFDSQLVWMFHHEGVWTLFDGRRHGRTSR